MVVVAVWNVTVTGAGVMVVRRRRCWGLEWLLVSSGEVCWVGAVHVIVQYVKGNIWMADHPLSGGGGCTDYMCEEVARLIVHMSRLSVALLGSGPRTVRTSVHSRAAKGVRFRAWESSASGGLTATPTASLLHLVRGATS